MVQISQAIRGQKLQPKYDVQDIKSTRVFESCIVDSGDDCTYSATRGGTDGAGAGKSAGWKESAYYDVKMCQRESGRLRGENLPLLAWTGIPWPREA